MERFIVYNAIKCIHCGDLIQSKHVHDMVMCSCNSVGCDGGTQYLKRTGDDYIDASVYSDDDFSIIRELFKWGSNYDKNNKLLDKTNWIKLKDIKDDHLDAIIEYLINKKEEKFITLFLKEKQFRSEKELSIN